MKKKFLIFGVVALFIGTIFIPGINAVETCKTESIEQTEADERDHDQYIFWGPALIIEKEREGPTKVIGFASRASNYRDPDFNYWPRILHLEDDDIVSIDSILLPPWSGISISITIATVNAVYDFV